MRELTKEDLRMSEEEFQERRADMARLMSYEMPSDDILMTQEALDQFHADFKRLRPEIEEDTRRFHAIEQELKRLNYTMHIIATICEDKHLWN